MTRSAHRPVGEALEHHRRLRTGIVQLIYVVLAFCVGLVVPHVPVGITVESGRAAQALVAVGAGMVAFIGLVYSLLFLVVQFGTTTFTPRLNTFRDAPIVWHAFAFFTGIIVFSFTAAFAIGKDAQTSALVPIVLVIALLVAITLFRLLQTTAFRSIQLAAVLAQVRQRGREVIEGVYPTGTTEAADEGASSPAPAGPTVDPATESHAVTWHGDSLVAQQLDVPGIVELAERSRVVVELSVTPGETVAEGSVIAIVRGAGGAALDEAILEKLTFGPERTFEQDPAFALRVLADIALRALSPAVNDPTTAVQALDSIDSLLRTLAARNLDIATVVDNDGVPRVRLRFPSWEDYVALGLDEIISNGLSSSQVRARIERLLTELSASLPHDKALPLQTRLDQLNREERISR
jgi:uncharacterized membrane protein